MNHENGSLCSTKACAHAHTHDTDTHTHTHTHSAAVRGWGGDPAQSTPPWLCTARGAGCCWDTVRGPGLRWDTATRARNRERGRAPKTRVQLAKNRGAVHLPRVQHRLIYPRPCFSEPARRTTCPRTTPRLTPRCLNQPPHHPRHCT